MPLVCGAGVDAYFEDRFFHSGECKIRPGVERKEGEHSVCSLSKDFVVQRSSQRRMGQCRVGRRSVVKTELL